MKTPRDEIAQVAEMLLALIADCTESSARIEAEHQAAVARIDADHAARLAPVRRALEDASKDLLALMRTEKRKLFGAGDLLRLKNGVLLRQLLDRIQIPRNALARCEELGFNEVIRIAKSLDRAAVEKWSDSRLALIGAARKVQEAFNYEITPKKEAK